MDQFTRVSGGMVRNMGEDHGQHLMVARVKVPGSGES